MHHLREWEHLDKKISDYKNHQSFTLRCVNQDLMPVSLKLKTTIKRLKAQEIINKRERKLLK